MLKVHEIAHICHDANRAYCRYLGDDSQPAWEDAPGWQIASACNGVQAHRADPELTPERAHRGWLAEKTADGWTWGPVKDPLTKQHPCFLPFDELSRDQQAKDHLFGAICKALIPFLDPSEALPSGSFVKQVP